jgi:predicted nucleic acid-binding protein
MSTPVFVDTSAIYAVLDADDVNHDPANVSWQQLLHGLESDDFELVTHGSVVVELVALAQRRLGMEAVRVVLDDLIPLFTTVWVNQDLHDRASAAILAAGLRGVSLVDWTSFEVMRQRAIELAFAFDDDFQQRGFGSFPGDYN